MTAPIKAGDRVRPVDTEMRRRDWWGDPRGYLVLPSGLGGLMVRDGHRSEWAVDCVPGFFEKVPAGPTIDTVEGQESPALRGVCSVQTPGWTGIPLPSGYSLSQDGSGFLRLARDTRTGSAADYRIVPTAGYPTMGSTDVPSNPKAPTDATLLILRSHHRIARAELELAQAKEEAELLKRVG